MTAPPFRIRLWGVRGSLAVGGADTAEFGGNTMCIEMRLGDHVLIFDAGSGLADAGAALVAEGRREVTMLFTHWHYDHVIGLPFFAPFFQPGSAVRVWSGHNPGGMTTGAMMADFMRAPFFPVGPACFRAQVQPGDFRAGDVLEPMPGVVIRTGALNHPGGATGYRVEWGGRVAALITDTEHVPGTLDPAVLDLIRGADLVLYDACYEDAEFPDVCGFGHSTWQQAVRLAQAAGVGRMGLIHHSIRRSDADLRRIEGQAQAGFAGAFCARERQVIDL